MPKVCIVFDLSTSIGTARLAPSSFPVVPRGTKRGTELYIAHLLLKRIGEEETRHITDIRPADADPPDVYFRVNGEPRGLEATELVPENRFERDAIIRRMKEGILRRLSLSKRTQNWVATVALVDDYAAKIAMPDPTEDLASTLDSFFQAAEAVTQGPHSLAVPSSLRGSIRSIVLERWDLTSDPRISRRWEPLIVFTTAHTKIVPECDIPKLIKERMERKARTDPSIPTWLVLWSEHFALAPFSAEIVSSMDRFQLATGLPYERVFYLHHHEVEPNLHFFT